MINTDVLQSNLLPQPYGLTGAGLDWAKQLVNSLKAQGDSMVEAQRTMTLELQDEYIAADAFLEAAITVELGVLTTAVSALAVRTTTIEADMYTAVTGVLARITTVESAYVAGDLAVAATVTTLSATVDTKTKTFRQTTAPSATAIGDLWIDSDDSNKLYRATATGSGSWVLTDDSRIATTLATVTNIAEAYATNNGSTARLVWEVAVGTNVATIVQTAAAGYADGTWNGSAIVLSAAYITLAAEAINFGNDTTYEDTYNTFYTVGGSYRYRDRGPFGASSDLLQWYGLNSVTLNSETKTNGIFALGTDGVVYLAGNDLTAQAFDATNEGDNDLTSGVSTTGTAQADVVVVGGDSPFTYQWVYQFGDATVTIDNAFIANPTFSKVWGPTPDSTFSFWKCYVTDNSGRVKEVAADLSGTSA